MLRTEKISTIPTTFHQERCETGAITKIAKTALSMSEPSIPARPKKESALQVAARSGDMQALREALLSGADPNWTNPATGESLLHIVTKEGDYKLVLLLCENGVDPKMTDKTGNTPLSIAMKAKRTDLAHIMVALGAPIPWEQQPLHLLASMGDIEGVKRLIDEGGDLNTRDSGGDSALCVAIKRGNYPVARLLIESGIDLRIPSNEGFTVHHLLMLLPGDEAYAILKMIEERDPESFKEADARFRQKFAAHALHIAGDLETRESESDPAEKSPLELGSIRLWVPTLRENLFRFTTKEDAPLSLETISPFLGAIQESTDEGESPKKAFKRWKRGKPVIVSGGLADHAVVYLVWKDYIAICNRGELSTAPVQVHRFNKRRLKEEHFATLMKRHTSEAYEKKILEDLPKVLGKRESKNASFIEALCPLKMQIVNNCSMTSLTAAVWATLTIGALIERKGASTIAKRSQAFGHFILFNQVVAMRPLLDGGPFLLNEELISTALSSLEEQKEGMLPFVRKKFDKIFKWWNE